MIIFNPIPVRQISPRFNFTRSQLRALARAHGVKRGRNTLDTLNNLIGAGVVTTRLQIVLK